MKIYKMDEEAGIDYIQISDIKLIKERIDYSIYADIRKKIS